MSASGSGGRRGVGRAMGGWPVAVLGVAAFVQVAVRELIGGGALSSTEAAHASVADRPLGQLLDECRRRGLRPLWYVLERGWIVLFGAGDRSLHLSAAVLALAAIPLAFALARAAVGSDLGALAAVAVVGSPLVFRSGIRVGPDSLVILVVIIGVAAFAACVRSSSPLPAVLLGTASAAAVWTDTWGLFVVVGGVVAAAGWAIGSEGAARRRAVVAGTAMVVGAATVLPWTTQVLPHVDAGRAVARVRPAAVLTTALGAFHGGPEPVMFLALVLALVGLVGRAVDERFLVLDFRGRRDAVLPALALLGALAAVAAAGLVRRIVLPDATFAVVVPLFLLLVAIGLWRLTGRSRAAGTALFLVLSMLAVGHLGGRDVTQVDDAAAVLRRHPSQVVVVCSEDLLLALRREVPRGTRLVDGSAPVDRPVAGDFYLVQGEQTGGTQSPTPTPCADAYRTLPEGSRVHLLLAPDRDDSDEPVQVDQVRLPRGSSQ